MQLGMADGQEVEALSEPGQGGVVNADRFLCDGNFLFR